MSDARCKVCTHPERGLIEKDITSGMSNTRVASHWGMSKDSVMRHKRAHLSAALKGVIARRDTESGTRALDRLEGLYGRAEGILDAATEEGKASMSLAAIKELRGIVELLAKLTGELDERPTVQVLNVSTSPEWLATRDTLMRALMPFPDAAQAVAQALEAGEGRG
ncbi:hypothetical protein [Demequina iriomotensis]|uniref:hypothetical protein n=1 Tax=Demequina iriomotensis TaxID=1536641 RepID=UPI000783E699|nr:hypothetical protein [Demequina iriomotensis]